MSSGGDKVSRIKLAELFSGPESSRWVRKELSPREQAALWLLVGALVFIALFLLIIFGVWVSGIRDLESCLRWVQILREVCLPVATLLLGYLFGVKKE